MLEWAARWLNEPPSNVYRVNVRLLVILGRKRFALTEMVGRGVTVGLGPVVGVGVTVRPGVGAAIPCGPGPLGWLA